LQEYVCDVLAWRREGGIVGGGNGDFKHWPLAGASVF
jgi:hypothetical protein